MTENQKEALRYKDYPEGSGGKAIYDRYFLPFQVYLNKYYSSSENEEWNKWYSKYIEPAYDEHRHDEMLKIIGYIKNEYHNFEIQYEVYEQLKEDIRLNDELKRFIGFLAGAKGTFNFFKKYNLTIEQWFAIKNWQNPYMAVLEDGKSINEILNYQYGNNYLKTLLIQMPFWNR